MGEIKEEPAGDSSASQQQKIIAPAKIVAAARKSDALAAKEYMNSFLSNIKMQEQQRKKEASNDDEMLDRILQPKATMQPNKTATTIAASALVKVKQEETTEQPRKKAKKEATPEPDDNDLDFSCLDDDENQFELAASKVKPAVKPELKDISASVANGAAKPEAEDMNKLLNNWESICQMDDDFEKSVLASEAEAAAGSDPVDVEQLRFWYWEAWEDAQKLPGEVFLFGRTADGKSICVRVQNINRVLYLLPRQYVSIKLMSWAVNHD